MFLAFFVPATSCSGTILEDFLDTSLFFKSYSIIQAVEKGEILSSYSHSNKVFFDQDLKKPDYRCNCYGFLALFMEKDRFFKKAFQELSLRMKMMADKVHPSVERERPCPGNYAALFKSFSKKSARYWDHIPSFLEAQPGDVFVYTPFDYSVPKVPKKGKSGTHVAIIESVSWNSLKDQWCLTIFDSTSQPHSRNDSRWRKKKKERRTGIGRAKVYLQKWGNDEDGKYNLRWSGKGKIYKKEIILGRLRQKQLILEKKVDDFLCLVLNLKSRILINMH